MPCRVDKAMADGRCRSGLPQRREMLPYPVGVYATCKLTGEHLCYIIRRIYGLEAVTVHYFNTFGRVAPEWAKFQTASSREAPTRVQPSQPDLYSASLRDADSYRVGW